MTDLSSPQMGELMNGRSDGTARLEATFGHARGYRFVDTGGGPWDGTDSPASAVPVFAPAGMNVHQLSDAQRDFTAYARRRIEGVGAAQYSGGDRQKFEDMTVGRIVDETLDELADVVNYCTFMAVQLQRLKQRVEAMA